MTPEAEEKKDKKPRRGWFSERDITLLKEGNHLRAYKKMGSHLTKLDGVPGAYFTVWAPNAQRVSVIGEFNGWNPDASPMNARQDGSGIWELFVPGAQKGNLYKYRIVSKINNYTIDKADPYAWYSDLPPHAASRIWDLNYHWNDAVWMTNRASVNNLKAPMSVYEVHLGSWRRVPHENNRFLTYQEMARDLVNYVKEMDFTHVEFIPVMEHPFYGSWGYQTLGYFAPTSRYGSPQDFMFLIDQLHQNGIGVILDWVPSHFPSDAHGLAYFDGTHLYEHADRRKGFHPDWKSYIFNYSRNEVRDFLISSAMFWLDKYHADGLRVDAVASMIYLDYGRKPHEWEPNQYGGKENIEAINFIKKTNESLYLNFPDVQIIAEESTAWPMVSRPVSSGGLGFGLKWNMGWMHDTLEYFSNDPIHRKHHQNKLTFSMWYAYTENFLLPLSHDEVVYGKKSLVSKMPGDYWQKFANLRLLLGYMYGQVGKKLLFMGGEFAQFKEWDHDTSLDWHLLGHEMHKGIQQWVRDLNHLYRNEPAFYELDYVPAGFKWIDFNDWQNSVISFIRSGSNPNDHVVVVCNFTPTTRYNYRIGVPHGSTWVEILNSDSRQYGGSGISSPDGYRASAEHYHGMPQSISLSLPPLAVIMLKPKKEEIPIEPVPPAQDAILPPI